MGTPVGVLVIPEGFAPDGKARMMSLKWVNDLGAEAQSPVNIAWRRGDNMDTSLTNHNRVPTTDNAGSTTTGSNYYGYLPSDQYTGATSYVDPTAKYRDTSYTPYIPSPYLGDKPNPAYYAPISGYNNALADFDGKGNTDVLSTDGSHNAAFGARNYHVAGAEEIEWYLPAAGELGYVFPRFNKIQAALTKVSASQLYSSGSWWSSTEFSNSSAYRMDMSNGSIDYYGKFNNYFVRPFAMLD